MKKLNVILTAVLMFVLLSSTYSQTPIKLSLTGGIAAPTGNFSDLYKLGYAFEGGAFYSIPMLPLDLTLTAGYSQFAYKNEYFTNSVTSNLGVGVTGFNPEWNATDISVMFGTRYNIPAPGFAPYISGEIGVHLLSFNDRFTGRVIGNSSNPTTFNLSGATESGSETAFGYAIGAGVVIPLALKVGIDISIKYNGNSGIYSKTYEVFRNNNSKFTNPELKNMSFITARAGVLVTL